MTANRIVFVGHGTRIKLIAIPTLYRQTLDKLSTHQRYRDRYATTRDFAETFMEKYRRIERFGKPVIVAELGVAGHANYRQQWMSQISEFSTGRNPFPLLTGIIYFNDKEPYHWPDGYGSPDWSRTILEFGRKEAKDIAPAKSSKDRRQTEIRQSSSGEKTYLLADKLASA